MLIVAIGGCSFVTVRDGNIKYVAVVGSGDKPDNSSRMLRVFYKDRLKIREVFMTPILRVFFDQSLYCCLVVVLILD